MNERGKPPIGMNDRVWWLGGAEKDNYLRENTWLIAAEGKSVLIDPGPVPGFQAIFKSFSSVGDLQNLTAIAVTQGHPDACASLPLWEKAGFSGKIIAHWKTALLLPSLGIRSAFRYVYRDETDGSGQFLGLRLIPLPNLGNGGSLALYDSGTKTLFSGNLFGFYGRNSPLLGAPDSLERVAQYHALHVPSGELLSRALDTLEPLEARLVCPQHGSARSGDIPELFAKLRAGSYGGDAQGDAEFDPAQETELELLRKEHLRLQENLVLGQDDIMLDRLTGLYNRTFLDEFFPAFVAGNPDGAIASFRLDGLKALAGEEGESAVETALRIFAGIVVETRGAQTMAFRDSGPSVLLLFQDEEAAIPELLRLQKAVSASQAFSRRMTASGAVAFCAESTDPTVLTETLRERTRVRDGMGPGSICVSTEGNEPMREGSLLLVESDRALARLFADFFAALRFDVQTAGTGEEALAAISRKPPALVVCEERFPLSDVFAVHESFARGTGTKGRNFIMLTERKNDRLIKRAFESGIRYVLEKPVALSELEYLAKALWEDTLAER